MNNGQSGQSATRLRTIHLCNRRSRPRTKLVAVMKGARVMSTYVIYFEVGQQKKRMYVKAEGFTSVSSKRLATKFASLEDAHKHLEEAKRIFGSDMDASMAVFLKIEE